MLRNSSIPLLLWVAIPLVVLSTMAFFAHPLLGTVAVVGLAAVAKTLAPKMPE